MSFDIEERPGGADGDNIVKTRLATDEMADVFFYNSGSLLQALNPSESLVDLAGDPMLDNVVDAFLPTVSQGDGVFGVPIGTGLGGGILYNRTSSRTTGSSVPLTWEEFAANNDALLEAGITPVGASFGTTWTSQLFVLADYYNVAQEVPDFAEQYTANEAHYADTPAALRSFERLQEAYDSGWWNEDYGSATYEDALRMLVDGEIAQYPMLTFALSEIASLYPDAIENIGFFAQPGETAETNGMTLWMPAGMYIADTTEHEDVARAFLAFIASVEGTEAQTAAAAPCGPYLSRRRHAARRRAAGRARHAGVHRRRQRRPGARVPLAAQGPQPRADHRRGRLRAAQRRGCRRPLRRGRREAGPATRPAGLVTQALHTTERKRAGPVPAAASAPARSGSTAPMPEDDPPSPRLPALVLPAGQHRLRRHLRRADGDGVLLLAHPLDAVRLGVHRTRELPPVLPRTGADQRSAQHVHLRRRHERV